jgi:hypothetical protein
MNNKIHPKIVIGFSEAWWLHHYGRYVPEGQRPRLLWERFGEVGLGQEKPDPASPQVYEGEWGHRFMSAFWGCEIQKGNGLTPAAIPLSDPLTKMKQLQIPDIKSSPVVKQLIERSAAVRKERGPCRVVINYGGPLNNAVSVFGDEMLVACAAEPDLAREVLMKMAQALVLVHIRVVSVLNKVDAAIAMRDPWSIGDCPVCMISPATYQQVVLPVDLWMREQFINAFELHHCGIFDTYADVYQPLHPTQLDLGPGSDLRLARQKYPQAGISTYLDVAKISKMGRDEIRREVKRLADDAGDPRLFTKIEVADVGPELTDDVVRYLMTVFCE